MSVKLGVPPARNSDFAGVIKSELDKFKEEASSGEYDAEGEVIGDTLSDDIEAALPPADYESGEYIIIRNVGSSPGQTVFLRRSSDASGAEIWEQF